MKNPLFAASATILIGLAASPSHAQDVSDQPVAATPDTRHWGPTKRDIPIKKDNVYAEVASFTGAFRMDGYSNADRTRRFWTNVPVEGRKLALPLDYDYGTAWVRKCYNRSSCANGSHQWIGYYMVDDMHNKRINHIDKAYAKAAPAAFDSVVDRLQAPLNQSQSNDTALKNVVEAGRNTIHYVVTPRTSKWSVLFRIYTMDTGGNVAIVQETFLDQDTGGTAPVITLNVTP